jgi:hypothetical protein
VLRTVPVSRVAHRFLPLIFEKQKGPLDSSGPGILFGLEVR